jgi:RimJ/RimL family protein N-acetyltransferase
VLVQYVVRRNGDGQPVGHVVAYAADQSLHHANLGAVFQPQCTGTGLAAQAVALFARYLFHTFPLHKLYLEIPGYNWPQVRSGEHRLFHVEGVLRDHDYYAGRYWDQYLCAIYPDRLPGDAP